jgi:hypothetical protein
MSRHRYLLGAALLVLVAARPLSAQRVLDWQNRWYWGAKGGMLNYSLPTAGNVFAPQVGGEWLITARRVALYVGYSTTFQAEGDTFAIKGLSGTANGVTFDAFRRIQIAVLAMIGDKDLQPYIGGGFVIHSLSNARSAPPSPQPPSQTVQDDIKSASSGGFFMMMAGIQLRFGGKGALFAQYQYSAQGHDFLLAGGANSLEAGLRWAFLPAKENDPTRRP